MIRLFLALCILFSASFSKTSPQKRVLILGDSLSDGYGLVDGKSFIDLAQKKLTEEGYDVFLDNQSVSGSTSSTGVFRLKYALDKERYDVLVLELGANDGLRGYDLDEMKNNLSRIISMSKSHGMKILLVGMNVPTNYGETYREGFVKVFRDLSKQVDAFMPSLLAKTALKVEYTQKDNLHPNEKGHEVIAKDFVVYLEKVL